MREIKTNLIESTIKDLCIKACCSLTDDVKTLINEAKQKEESSSGKQIFKQIEENISICEKTNRPLCQDTGMAVIFVEVGQDVHITGGSLYDAINNGVASAYKEAYLRKSVLTPITRKNTGDNTPAIIHTEIVAGNNLKITVAPKGFGSENMSRLIMLKPSDGIEGIKDFIIETVELAGANPCPPIILGVGIGGTMEKCAYLAKKALLRDTTKHNEDSSIKALEEELLLKINKLGIGPQGLGGNYTALAVNIETFPTHIAGLPIAINIQCHVSRHRSKIL